MTCPQNRWRQVEWGSRMNHDAPKTLSRKQTVNFAAPAGATYLVRYRIERLDPLHYARIAANSAAEAREILQRRVGRRRVRILSIEPEAATATAPRSPTDPTSASISASIGLYEEFVSAVKARFGHSPRFRS